MLIRRTNRPSALRNLRAPAQPISSSAVAEALAWMDRQAASRPAAQAERKEGDAS